MFWFYFRTSRLFGSIRSSLYWPSQESAYLHRVSRVVCIIDFLKSVHICVRVIINNKSSHLESACYSIWFIYDLHQTRVTPSFLFLYLSRLLPSETEHGIGAWLKKGSSLTRRLAPIWRGCNSNLHPRYWSCNHEN